MTFTMIVLLTGVMVGLMAVASNPSPYFGALGLVLASGMGCGVLLCHGGSFLSMVLFLIYLGGMLVVFAYSAALAAEPFPETWGSRPVMGYMMMYAAMVVVLASIFWGSWSEFSWVPADEMGVLQVSRVDLEGVAIMYSAGGGMLFITAFMLLITLIVVLELTRGLARGALRAI
uniref:NADH-ubiquinone oxidoreductase chain 6 n=1 Tax=Serranus annularis TaxID=2969294 RepID=A0AA95Z6F0_9TELE|nr:NADH dehydrogenase subunit 6 [Serranus annularis]